MEYDRGLGRPLSIHQHQHGPESMTQVSPLPPTSTERAMYSPASASAPLPQTRKSQDDVPMSTSSGFARSASSTSTAREEDIDALRRKRSKELGSPSDKQYRRAGMAGVGAVGAGAGVAGILAHHGKTTPAGWRDVSVDGKHQIWSSHLSGPRKSALKKILLVFGFITLWLWICLSIFWGSTYSLLSYFSNLNIHLVSFDNDPAAYLNTPMTEMAQQQSGLPSSMTHLGWSVRSASDYTNGLATVEDNILSQKAWATVVINANATSAWLNAVRNGDPNYDPTGAVTIYLQTARFYQVTLLYIEATLTENLVQPLTEARNAAFQDFAALAQGNAGALAAAQASPQAIGTGFGYTIRDLRSISNGAWSGAAPMEAALIYYVIFAFYIAFFGGVSRMKSGLKNRLSFRSMIALRLGWPLLAYFFMSLWFTLIERAWQIPVSAFMGSGGFPALWALNYVTLIAAGFAMETMLSLLGLQWLPFFLILWIILNITSSFYPIVMMPRFYRFLRWTPFLHNIEGFKIIAYGTNLQHRLGKHFGIIFGLIGVELIGLPLAIFFERWSTDKAARKQQAEKEKEKDES